MRFFGLPGPASDDLMASLSQATHRRCGAHCQKNLFNFVQAVRFLIKNPSYLDLYNSSPPLLRSDIRFKNTLGEASTQVGLSLGAEAFPVFRMSYNDPSREQ